MNSVRYISAAFHSLRAISTSYWRRSREKTFFTITAAERAASFSPILRSSIARVRARPSTRSGFAFLTIGSSALTRLRMSPVFSRPRRARSCASAKVQPSSYPSNTAFSPSSQAA